MQSKTLSYDANGNLTATADSVQSAAAMALPPRAIESIAASAQLGTDQQSFTYDSIDRLTNHASRRYGNDSYSYDALGNVRTATAFGSFEYDASNRMVQRVNGAVRDTYTWDSRGNLTYGNNRSLSWNLANELQSDATGNVYTYDARGWRVKRTATAAASFDGRAHVRYAIYDANHQLKAVRDSDIWRDFIHLGTRPIARIEGTATTWILGNYQNSPLIETNAAGQVTRLVTQRGIVRADGFWLRRLVHRGRGWGAGTTA